MPLPVLVGKLVVVATSGLGAAKICRARRRIKKANARLQKQKEKYDEFIIDFEKKHKYVSSKMQELGNLRLEAVELLGEVVRFLRNAKLKERDLQEEFDLGIEVLDEWEEASINASDVLKGITGAALSGIGTASSVYGLVGTLASASTGTAISSLSGIAAKNATLAWLGGGPIASGGGGVAAGTVVVGGLIVGPALLVTGFALDKSAEKVESQVEREISKLKKDEADKKKVMATLDTVLDRIEELMSNTKRLMERLRDALANADPSKIEDSYLVARIAKSLAELLESRVIDERGNIC